MKIHFLPVVWQDTFLIEKDGYFGLIDACVNMEKIGNYFSKVGVKKLDFIILTHFHKDHYGSLAKIVEAYPVEKVIFKDFSGVVSCTSDGKPADDAYRVEEIQKCEDIKETTRKHSKLIMSDTVSEFLWMGITFKFFYTDNILKTIYEDESSPYYHRFVTTENRNNMAIFFEYAGRNVLLSGDITDSDSGDERTSFLNLKMARELNCKLDIYKVAHHGKGVGTKETLEIYRPDYAVITNKEVNVVDAVEQLKAANKDTNIYIMSNGGKVFDISPDGEMEIADLVGYELKQAEII